MAFSLLLRESGSDLYRPEFRLFLAWKFLARNPMK